MVFEECEGVNEAVMVIDQTLLKQLVLKKMKVDWHLLNVVVSGDHGRHLQVSLVLPTHDRYDECEDVLSAGEVI